jgi:glycine/D-amino acid oxidase-like deaminating enzyme
LTLCLYIAQVIGGGVVGLAVARQLAARPGTSTVLLERHDAPGTETSSRNSEVRISPFLRCYRSEHALMRDRSSTQDSTTERTR